GMHPRVLDSIDENQNSRDDVLDAHYPTDIAARNHRASQMPRDGIAPRWAMTSLSKPHTLRPLRDSRTPARPAAMVCQGTSFGRAMRHRAVSKISDDESYCR